jgi:hypothetical protein
MVTQTDDAHKISVGPRAAQQADHEHARSPRLTSNGALVSTTGDPGSPTPEDGDIAVDADVEMIGRRPRAHRSSGTDRWFGWHREQHRLDEN